MFKVSPTIHVIIDVFRAFSTATSIIQAQPQAYILTNSSVYVRQLMAACASAILVGKPEKGSTLRYTIPNSPTLASRLTLAGRLVLHRTTAGATGVLAARDAAIVLCVGFNNLQATVDYIQSFQEAELVIHPMGHEANTATLEDDLCAMYLAKLLQQSGVNIHLPITQLQAEAGQYFFQHHPEYPQEDFARCLQINSHNFAIIAEVKEVYAYLRPDVAESGLTEPIDCTPL